MAFPIQNLVIWTIDHNSYQGGVQHLPFVGWMAFYALHKVHGCWYWNRKFETWKPDNGFALAVGLGIQTFLGDLPEVKMAAKVTEIARYTLEAAEALIRLKHSCHNLKKVFTKPNIVPVEIDHFLFLQQKGCLSPSSRLWIEIKRQEAIKKFHLVIDCILNIFRDLYLVSMHVMDAEYAFHGDFVQVAESPVHAVKIYRCDISKITEDLRRGFGMEGMKFPMNGLSFNLKQFPNLSLASLL